MYLVLNDLKKIIRFVHILILRIFSVLILAFYTPNSLTSFIPNVTLTSYHTLMTYDHHELLNPTYTQILLLQFECCGIDNYMDFLSATRWQDKKNTSDIIPLTCCKFTNKESFYKDVNSLNMDDTSCQTSPSDENSNFRKARK